MFPIKAIDVMSGEGGESKPAELSDGGEAGGAEAVTAYESEVAEGGEGAGKKGEVGVGDGHALEADALEPGVGGGHGGHPGGEAGAPADGDEIKVREAGAALEDQRPGAAEPAEGAGRGHRVAVADEKLKPGPRLGAVPGPAHQRRRVPVPAARQELQHVLQDVLKHLAGEGRRLIDPPSDAPVLQGGRGRRPAPSSAAAAAPLTGRPPPRLFVLLLSITVLRHPRRRRKTKSCRIRTEGRQTMNDEDEI